MNTDGNMWFLEMQERAQARYENKLPYCDGCGEKIYGEIYDINNNTFCEDCAEEEIKETEWLDYVSDRLRDYKRDLDVY